MLLKNNYLLLLCLFVATGMAQECRLELRGTVRDEDNSESLSFAVVKMLLPEKVIQCNENGFFEFTGLCPGTYQILVRHLGCRDTVFEVQLLKSKKITLKLPHSLNALNDVEITARHEETKPVQSIQTLDAKDLDKSRGASLGDQLKQLNGVSTFNTGPTIVKPMINGMQGYRVLILNNGVRQEGQQWGNEHAPEIDPFVATRLSVVRGAATVRYGSDAIGGVILADPGALPDTVSLTGEYNAVGVTNGRGGATSLMLQGNFEKIKYFSWRMQGSLKRTGDLKTPEYYLKNTGVSEKNISGALAYHRKKFGASAFYSQFQSSIGVFTGAHIGNLTDLYAAFNSSKPQDSLAAFSYSIGRPFQKITHELIKLSVDLHTGPRSRLYLNYAWQFNSRQEFDKHLPRNAYLASLNNPELYYLITTQTGELVWEHNYIRSFRGKFGSQLMYQENVYLGKYFIPNYYNKTAGVFAIERFVRPRYELEAGLRYDLKAMQSFYYEGATLLTPTLFFGNLSYNFGGIYKPYHFLHFYLNAAHGWRAPAVNELYSNGLHHGVGAIERGDPNLKPEYCDNLIGTTLFQKKNISAELTAYTYRFKNFIYYLPSDQPELTVRGAFPVFYYVQNNANISGSDFQLRYKIHKYISLKTRGMWVRGHNIDLNQPLIYMPPARYEFSFTLSIKDRQKLRDVYAEPIYLYVSRQNRVPQGVDFVPPPSAYHLIGINAGFTWLCGKQPLVVTLSVTNAANAIYRDYLDRFRYYSDATGSNYTLRLRIPFSINVNNKNK